VIIKATLKKPWRSHRGKLYPAGTTFKLNKRLAGIDSGIYDFVIPGECHGFVVLPNKIFQQLTEDEKMLKSLRRQAAEEHMKSYKDRFIKKKI